MEAHSAALQFESSEKSKKHLKLNKLFLSETKGK